MADTSPIDKNNCFVCSSPIFHFERKVKVMDLEQEEKAACSLMENADQTRMNTDSKAVLCVSCYRKVQRGGGGSTGAEGKKSEDKTDSSQKEKSSPTQTSLRSSRRNSATGCSSEEVTKPEATKPAVSDIDGSTGSVPAEPVSVTHSGQSHSMGLLTRLLPFVMLALAVLGSMVIMMSLGTVEALAVCLVVSVIYLAVKTHEFQRWFALIFEPGKQSDMTASSKPKPRMSVSQAAASTVVSGDSLAGTSTLTLLQDGYWVTCGIEVENWTCFTLSHPHVEISRGTLTLAPSNIAPACREVMIARKPSGLAEGTYGTVSWLIQPMDRRMVVMWSAPFNFNHFSNWLAVGLTDDGTTQHLPGNDWFKQMYYKDSTKQLQFERAEYCTNIRPVLCRDREFEVEGIMSSDHKAVVKVILRPLGDDFFASSIMEKLNNAV